MCNMQFFAIYFVLVAVSIGSTRASFIFDGLASLFEPSSGCTILVRVPLVPYDPYFKAELFPSLQVKLDENQSRFNRNLGQVWVDAPDPIFCGNRPSNEGRCVLNGYFPPQPEALIFKSGERKKIANEQLYAESRARNLPYYNVYANAPDRFCKRTFGGIADFFG